MKYLVIIPTYNEKDNIVKIVPEILEKYPEVHVLVVDDNSPDGTGQLVKDMSAKDQRVHLFENPNKGGLGKAYLAGYTWAIEHGYEAFVQMDADFSHRIEDLGHLLTAIRHQDLVVGSRYIPGGATTNWAWYRKLISRFGSLYARIILGFPLNDWTGGFNAWRSETLQKINFSEVRSNGYSFQIEMKYRALKNGAQAQEVPIIFDERREGQSKMSLKIVIEAFFRVWQIRFLA
jgi:dolichol-phosphate mannosyltransferase